MSLKTPIPLDKTTTNVNNKTKFDYCSLPKGQTINDVSTNIRGRKQIKQGKQVERMPDTFAFDKFQNKKHS